jgi:hypothetical protein
MKGSHYVSDELQEVWNRKKNLIEDTVLEGTEENYIKDPTCLSQAGFKPGTFQIKDLKPQT